MAKVGRPRVDYSCFGPFACFAVIVRQMLEAAGRSFACIICICIVANAGCRRVEHSSVCCVAVVAVVLLQTFAASWLNIVVLVRVHSLQLSCGKGWTLQAGSLTFLQLLVERGCSGPLA